MAESFHIGEFVWLTGTPLHPMALNLFQYDSTSAPAEAIARYNAS